ncbi:MAG: hypothetical protein ACETVR_03005 [Candidatus Bathyarchaeia archaeon]
MLDRYTNKTVHTYQFGVKKWLDVNGVKVDWESIDFPTTSVTREKDRAPTVKEIQRLFQHAPQIKDRVGVLILASSGLA